LLTLVAIASLTWCWCCYGSFLYSFSITDSAQ
jgi:hypothetical protein